MARLTRRRVLGLGGAAALSLAAACRPRVGRAERPNVLLVTLDTTRADHLGCYGYTRPTSPALDAIANDGLVYTRAVAPGTWTLPSHASLFTGKVPTSHGARYDPNGSLVLTSAIPDRPGLSGYRVRGVLPTETTLAGVLGQAGYRTGGAAGGPWLKKVFGLGTGFEWWDDDDIGSVNGRIAADLNARALPWLEAVSEPFLLFLNYFDAHGPLEPPPDYAARFLSEPITPGARRTPEQTLALYDAEIQYADHHLGEVVALLKRRGLYDRTWIIVTSDHGELFGEHGARGHGNQPYQEVLHVPFVSKPPRGDHAPGERAEWVQLTDVMPMVLDRLGVPRPEGTQGGLPPNLGRPVMAESYVLGALNPTGDWLAIIENDWKLMWNSQGRSELYDLANDPREQSNVFDQQPERVASLERLMNAYLAQVPRSQDTAPAREVDAATREALKSLGYLH